MRTLIAVVATLLAASCAASGTSNAGAAANGSSSADLDAGETFRDCRGCPQMVVVPGGEFLMGSPEGTLTSSTERPQHVVNIRSFAASVYEITAEEYAACRDAGACLTIGVLPPEEREQCQAMGACGPEARGRRPVDGASWDDAQDYARWLSERTGARYRLLTEAEWEYAARAGTTTRYAFGDNLNDRQARFASFEGSRPVGSYAPNAFGLYDMHGNVQEWVEDCYPPTSVVIGYEKAPTDGSAVQMDGCTQRVHRGGHWRGVSDNARSASRGFGRTDIPNRPALNLRTGIRIARDLE